MPGAVLGTRNTVVNKADESPCLGGADILEGRRTSTSQVNSYECTQGEKDRWEDKSGYWGTNVPRPGVGGSLLSTV